VLRSRPGVPITDPGGLVGAAGPEDEVAAGGEGG